MAEETNNSSVEYGASTYSNGWLVDTLDAGMHNNAQYIDSLGKLNYLTGDAYARVAAMSDPDVSYEELSAQFAAENEDWKSEAYKQLTKDCRINAALNGTALAISAASAVTSVGGAISYAKAGMGAADDAVKLANKVANKTRTETAATNLANAKTVQADAAKNLWSNQLLNKAGQEGTSTLARVGLKTAGYSLKAGEKLFSMARTVSGVGSGKTNLFRLAAGATIEIAPTALPVLAAHVYTNGRTEAVKDEYVAAINTQQGVYDYLCTSGNELSEDIQADYAGWQSNYETTQAQLLADFNSGKITKAQYDQAYGEFLESSQQQLDQLTADHKEAGQYILGKGAASAMGEEIIAHGYDAVQVSRTTPYLEKLAEENPEEFEATKAAVEAKQATSSGNAFVDFLANMNAALVHYLPAAAYVEAAIVKGVDTVMGFVADKVPIVSSILNYEQKHEGESISDIASAISETAEARYEAKQAADAMADDVSAGKDWQAATSQPSEDSGELAYT